MVLDSVIVPNKCMGIEYLARYGVQASVIHNPFDLAEYERNAAARMCRIHPGTSDCVYRCDI